MTRLVRVVTRWRYSAWTRVMRDADPVSRSTVGAVSTNNSIGTVGYCDGLHVDGAHRWVATGGVPIEFLIKTAPAIDPGTYRTEDGSLVHVRPSASGRMLVEIDGAAKSARGGFRVGVKLSDDPDWPDLSASHMTLLHAD